MRKQGKKSRIIKRKGTMNIKLTVSLTCNNSALSRESASVPVSKVLHC